MRKIIAAPQISLDGFIEGPNKELDWAIEDDERTWSDIFKTLDSIDTFLLGRVMYPDYERFWTSVLTNPTGIMPITGKPPTKNEIAYARLADKIPHVVVSKTLKNLSWKTTRIVRDLEEVRKLKQQPGKGILVWGGATLISNLMNAGLIDELRVIVNPIVLGGGKALFEGVKERHALKLKDVKPLSLDKVRLTYSTHLAEVTRP